MNLQELLQVLTTLYPDAKFSVWENNDNYMGQPYPKVFGDYLIDWPKDIVFPSDKALKDKYTEIKKDLEINLVQEKRALEYPAKEDLIVALWEKLVEGKEDKVLQLQAEREQVKQENPLPDSE